MAEQRAGIYANVRFDALRNAIYHTERRTFFDLVNRLVNLAVIVLGASVAGKVAELFHFREIWLELGVVLAATVQLVFDFGSRARTHEFLQKRYYDMLAEMESDGSEHKTKAWSAKMMTIAADEPMAMRALDALAYNRAVDATVADPEVWAQCRLHVPWYQRRLRHFFAFQGAQYITEASRAGFVSRCKMWVQSKWKGRGDGKEGAQVEGQGG